MTVSTVEVLNKAGIHARPANLIAKTAQKFTSRIELQNRSITCNAKSIMGVITLGATKGTVLKLIIDGEDEEIAEDEIKSLFLDKFGEDDND